MSKNITETKPEKQAVKKRPSELRDDELIGIQGCVQIDVIAGNGGATKAEDKGTTTRRTAKLVFDRGTDSITIVISNLSGG